MGGTVFLTTTAVVSFTTVNLQLTLKRVVAWEGGNRCEGWE